MSERQRGILYRQLWRYLVHGQLRQIDEESMGVHHETGVCLLQAVSERYRGNYRSKPGKHLEMLSGGSFMAAARSAWLGYNPPGWLKYRPVPQGFLLSHPPPGG